MKKNVFISFAIFASLAYSSTSLALKSDRDQPAQIEADNTEVNFRTGVRTLELVKAVADGTLARFKQRPDNKPEDVEGWAKNIFVDYPKNTITLTGKAALKQGGATATGDKIVYNMETDVLTIVGNSGIGTVGKNGDTPKRKLKDPFSDDAPSPNTGNTKKTSTNTSKTEKATDSTTETIEEEATQDQPEPLKSGRSRLILQPKKKD